MLIFLKDTNLRQFINLGMISPDSMNLIVGQNVCQIYNLSSIYNIGIRLSDLIPSVQFQGQRVDYMDDRGFDIYYANYILSHQPAFIAMMSIMYQVYLTSSAVVLIGNDEYKDYISDSLMKFIQQRYEYPIHIVEELDDIPEFFNDTYHFTSTFGLRNFDQDREQYLRLTISPQEIMSEYQRLTKIGE